jgi:hypothetical protein
MDGDGQPFHQRVFVGQKFNLQDRTTVEDWDAALVHVSTDVIEGEEIRGHATNQMVTHAYYACPRCTGPAYDRICGSCGHTFRYPQYSHPRLPLPTKIKKAFEDAGWTWAAPYRNSSPT